MTYAFYYIPLGYYRPSFKDLGKGGEANGNAKKWDWRDDGIKGSKKTDLKPQKEI